MRRHGNRAMPTRLVSILLVIAVATGAGRTVCGLTGASALRTASGCCCVAHEAHRPILPAFVAKPVEACGGCCDPAAMRDRRWTVRAERSVGSTADDRCPSHDCGTAGCAEHQQCSRTCPGVSPADDPGRGEAEHTNCPSAPGTPGEPDCFSCRVSVPSTNDRSTPLTIPSLERTLLAPAAAALASTTGSPLPSTRVTGQRDFYKPPGMTLLDLDCLLLV